MDAKFHRFRLNGLKTEVRQNPRSSKMVTDDDHVACDISIRDASGIRLMKGDNKSPEDVVKILNTILIKMNSKDAVCFVPNGADMVDEKGRLKITTATGVETE